MRGRKPHTPDTPAPVDVNHQALAEAGRALAVVGQEITTLQQQLGLEDMTPATLVREIKIWIDHSARAMFEVGIRLAALRSSCLHGEWMPLLHDQIGMSPRTAQRFIGAAMKCLGAEGQRERLLQLGRSKVMELVSLDDAELDEFERTGAITQLALDYDAIDSMSMTELRDRLRDRELTLAARQKRIQTQRDEIERLKDHAERPFRADGEAASAEERDLLDALRDCVVKAEAELLQLAHLLPLATDGTVGEACGLAMRQGAEYLAQRLADTLNTAGVEVQFEELVTPSWLKKAKAGKAAAGVQS